MDYNLYFKHNVSQVMVDENGTHWGILPVGMNAGDTYTNVRVVRHVADVVSSWRFRNPYRAIVEGLSDSFWAWDGWKYYKVIEVKSDLG